MLETSTVHDSTTPRSVAGRRDAARVTTSRVTKSISATRSGWVVTSQKFVRISARARVDNGSHARDATRRDAGSFTPREGR